MPDESVSQPPPESSPVALPRRGMAPALAVLWALLLPGAGHYALGRVWRGVSYFGIIVTLFVLGLTLGGRLERPASDSPLSYFKTAANLGVGPLYLGVVFGAKGVPVLSAGVPLGMGDPRIPTYEHGTTFLLTAGILNILLLFDAWDLASGRKD